MVNSVDENVDYVRKLVKKRDSAARRIVRSANNLQNAVEVDGDDMAIDAARIDRDELEKCFLLFEEVQNEIEEEVSGDELSTQEEERIRIETLVRKARVSASNFLRRSIIVNSDSTSPTVATVPSTKIKRPEITVPKFSGDVKKWSEFKNVFKSLVIDEKLYTDVERMIYLKQAVEGKAAEVISNFEISRNNFEKAWEKLRRRYENRRAVISNHLEALCKLPYAKSESEVAPLLDAATDAIESLNAVGVENGWQLMLCHLVATKLDAETRKQWELSIVQEEEYPTYIKLEKFLQQRVRVFESIGGANVSVKSTPVIKKEKNASEKSRVLLTKENQHSSSSSSTSSSPSVGSRLCFDCGASNHSLTECKSFIAKSIEEKTLVIQKRGLCFNCLNRGHRVAFCRLRRCEKCGKRHHILLHRDEQMQPRFESPQKQSVDLLKPERAELKSEAAQSFMINPASSMHICLPAALVYIFGANGHRYAVRAFLDSASGINAISEKLAKKLRCKFDQSNVTVSTLMPGEFTVSHSCTVTVKSRFNAFKFQGKFQVAPTISNDFSSFERTSVDCKLLANCKLADNPKINPGCVDLLIGAEFYEECMLTGKIKVGEKAYLRESEFGWVFIGLAKSVALFDRPSSCYLTLESNFQRFWTIDEIGDSKSTWTEEERRVDKEFEENFSRISNGKFMLVLPKNLTVDMLGESRNIAFRRLLAQEKRLSKEEKVCEDYNAFLVEYEELEHMTRIESSEALVYLPHHAVLREDSSTTSTRVVFNASSLTSSGYSLNDFLAKGPILQEDLFSILMRFRTHKIVFTADIEKMYRQVLIHPDDRKLQCILWRNPKTKLVDTYRLNTLTYGTKPASYLATKCLIKLSELVSEQYPESSVAVKSDFYMDDLLSGANSVEDATVRIQEIIEILKSGGFPLRKFASNSKEVLSTLDPKLVVQSRTFEDIEAVTVLGVKWTGFEGDQFKFFNKLSVEIESSGITKRSFLSKIFRIYDPLGLLAPIVISLKFLLQELWRSKTEWDAQVPESILNKFKAICRELEVLPSVSVPRWVEFSFQSEIHIFCDASQHGYGAAAYIRTVSEKGEYRVHLLSAKSRVAPIKVVSIPRLELCAALLGAKLFEKVRKSLRLPKSALIFAWSDSTIVLSWLYFESGSWSTFVANRVSKIREIIHPDRWFHVRSENNAADIISRGLESNFSRLSEFWSGPSFLKKGEDFLRLVELDPKSLVESKVKAKTCLVMNQSNFFIERFSNYETLISFVAYIMRFSKSLRDERYESLELTSFERLRAHRIVVKRVQANVADKIEKLDCFVDEEGIWRLRGRLGKSELTFESKYPIVLPKDRFLLLLIRYWHHRFFHAGVAFLRNFIRTSYHVLGDLNRLIRGVVYRCVTCRRFAKDLHYDPPVGELPSYRVTVSQAFVQVGVDFAGPFPTRAVGPSRNKGKVLFKSYVAIFVCMVSRAAHIEVVEDLSTKAFLDGFNRFVSRRGLCHTVYSDHGTNFAGAKRELRVVFDFLKKNRSELVSHCSKLGIDWKFIPERAPHFGGLWEAAVKSFKFHFKRVVGAQILSFSELSTLSCQIEAVLNARPICTSADKNTTVLTPAHLCIGKSINIVPPICGEVVKGAAKVRYSMVQSMFERFWAVWRHEYLIALRSTYFKRVGARKAQIDDIVLLKEDNTPPVNWPMGQIIRCHVGSDEVCRVVDVLVNGKIFRRPVVKLIPLLPE